TSRRTAGVGATGLTGRAFSAAGALAAGDCLEHVVAQFGLHAFLVLPAVELLGFHEAAVFDQLVTEQLAEVLVVGIDAAGRQAMKSGLRRNLSVAHGDRVITGALDAEMEDGIPSGGLRRQEALRREREEEHVELVLRGDLRPLGVLLAQ